MKPFLCQAKIISYLALILSNLLFIQVNGQTYGNLPMGGAGYVSGIIISKTEPGLMYCRTDVGGAYRWNEENSEWIPITDWVSSDETGYLGVESLAIDPGNPNNLYMSVGISYFNGGKSAILRSGDRGETFAVTDITSQFKVHGNGMGRNSGEKLAVDPNLGSILLCGSRSKGLFKSTDSGQTWSHVSSLNVTNTSTDNGISFVLFDPNSSSTGSATQTILVGASHIGENIYRSDDGGASFTAIAGAPNTFMPNRAALASDGNLYLSYTDAAGPWDISSGQMWRYKLSTGEWTNITPSGFTCGFGGISVDPENAQRLVASTLNLYMQQGSAWGERIFTSADGGDSWVDVVDRGFEYDSNGIPWNDYGQIHWAGSIEFDPFNTKRAYVISGNGVFMTGDIDAIPTVWKFTVNGLEETVPRDLISITNGPLISVVSDYDGCKYYDISKYYKRHSPSIGTTSGLAYAALNPETVVRTGSELYISSDTGSTWSKGTLNGSMGHVSLSADGATILHSPENSIKTYRSVNKGASWTDVLGLSISGGRTVADPVNSKVFYAYNESSGRMMVSLNGGSSFLQAGSTSQWGSKHIRTVPGYEGHVWLALYNGGLAQTIDYGTSINKISVVTNCDGVGIGKAVNNEAYPCLYIWGTVDGITGLFFSTDIGITWNRINDDAHEWGGLANGQFVIGDMNTAGLVYLSTAGRGIVYSKADYMLSSESLSVPVDSSMQITPLVLNDSIVTWSWSSGDPLVAEVDDSGLVTGRSPGMTIITATNDKGKSVTHAVKVEIAVIDITISPDLDSIDIDEEIQLMAIVNPDDATNNIVSWTSINSSSARVSSSGLVKGIKTGKTIITAVAGESKVDIPLVVGVPVSGISFSTNKDTISISETKQLVAVKAPANTTDTENLKWKSDSPEIVKVNPMGIITGMGVGNANITAYTSDGQFYATIEIVVSDISSTNLLSNEVEVKIYPNPLKGNLLNIDFRDTNNFTDISIQDISGRVIMNQKTANHSGLQIEINFVPGIYFIRLYNSHDAILRKLIINK